MPHSNLLGLLPADARRVVEICDDRPSNTRESALQRATLYRRINPRGEYLTIACDRHSSDVVEPAIAEQSVDCLVFDRTLTQVLDPLKLLQSSARWLSENGQVVACIPNVQYWHRLVYLLRGRGLEQSTNFDDCQLRFFSLETIKELFNQAGLNLYEVQTVGVQTEAFKEFAQTIAPVVKELGLDPQTFAMQANAEFYVVRGSQTQSSPRRLFVHTILMAPTACDRPRVLDPDRFSNTIPGVRAIAEVKNADLSLALPQEEKVFIWQRTILKYPHDFARLRELLRRDYLIIAEIDDDPLRRPQYEQNRFLSYRGCHGVQTSTEPLADYLRQHNPNVAVFANQLTELPPERTYKNDGTCTIFFGALNREADWEPIVGELNRVLGKYRDRVRVKVIHDRKFWNALQSLEGDRKDFEAFCPYERYLEIMDECDLALLPLTPTRVNSMKSDLKFLECAGHGVAVLASPVVYEHTIVEGKTGLIYRSVAEFGKHLEALITDPLLRQTLAQNAYGWVAENRLLCQHYRQRSQWYKQLRDRLPELNRQLRDRVPELFTD
ncbi:glycosyltransferase [Oxynema sp. CENA135]|uniref:glycosyltransferase family protein n=1 Tax=Oxynema sp. CENA135 TaxID=984206 RepID=UPI00190B4DBF|nr:glycosyltransferase [Oxynema sp. CENA135]MBK4729892.1 glycosyltransferase [Oxynema sp. CENA135]